MINARKSGRDTLWYIVAGSSSGHNADDYYGLRLFYARPIFSKYNRREPETQRHIDDYADRKSSKRLPAEGRQLFESGCETNCEERPGKGPTAQIFDNPQGIFRKALSNLGIDHHDYESRKYGGNEETDDKLRKPAPDFSVINSFGFANLLFFPESN